MSSPTVAIVGGTGFVGLNISNAFVTDFRSSFSRVRILTRDATTPKAQGLAYEGAELMQVARVTPSPEAVRRCTYFLSEFEADHRVIDFPGYESIEWQRRQELAREARRSFKGKVIALYTSLFFELALAQPVLGFDIANNEFTAYGSPAHWRITFNPAAKREALKFPDVSFHEYVRVVIREGKTDFGDANDNELVNPGGRLWVWKSVEDYVRGQFGARRSG